MKTYYVHKNAGEKIFVKEEEFFISQGGLTAKWGRAWRKVQAESIEDARLVGEKLLAGYKFASSYHEK